MPKRDVIVVGTSAGGLEALKKLVGQLPADLEAAVFVVWHMAADQPSLLPQILSRYSALPVLPAANGETFEPGRIYVASPDHHLVIDPASLNRIRVSNGPKENRFRPSVDVLFRSAARACGSRVIGVVMTGMLDDGASGLYAIKECGGVAVVQDPVDALYPDMPINAMKAVAVDHTVPISAMGALLVRLVNESGVERDAGEKLQGEEAVSKQMSAEVKVALNDGASESGALDLAEPSVYACPECHGVLMQMKEGPLLRFRCHTGHAYSLNALLSSIVSSVEDSLWNAIRALQESEMLMSQMAQHLREAGHNDDAELFGQRVQQTKQRVELVRTAVLNQTSLGAKIAAPGAVEDGALPRAATLRPE